MPEASQETVVTGLEALSAPAPEALPEPVQAAVQESAPAEPAPTDPAAPSNEPINFAEPISAADLTAGVGNNPEDAVPLVTAAQLEELQKAAARDDMKRDFTLKVLEARRQQVPVEHPAPPLAPRIAAQTNAEIAAGQKMNEHHAALQKHRPPPDYTNEKHQEVFRPSDWVPDQKKGQGYTQGRNL